MRYPLTANQLALWRTFPQAATYQLAIYQPHSILVNKLESVPNAYPGSMIGLGVAINGLNNVKRGMTLYVGSEPSKADYGTLRIRKDGTSGGSYLSLAEFGSGLINWQANACLTVVDDYRLWPIHPSYDTALSHWLVDLDPYTDQTKNFGPQVIIGPHMIGEMNSGKMLASYVGNLSYSHTTGVSITSQTWTFPDGQTVTSALGSSANPIVITYVNASPTGGVHTLKVTDSNGASHIGQRLTFAFGSGANQPIDTRFEQITGGLKSGGYRTKVYVDEGATSTLIADGARLIIWEKASYGAFTQSVGGNYFARDNIVMTGRVVADSQRIEPFTKSLSFDLETDDGEMRRAQGYDVFLESGSAASDWDMASGLTIDKAAIVLAKYRSTIANVMDFNIAGGVGTTNEIPYRDLPAGFLWDALNYNYAAEMGMVGVDLQGSLWAMLDTQVTGLSANVANVMAITLADRRDAITIGHPHKDVNSTTRLYAIQGGDANAPLGADSPGDRVGYFGNRQEISQNLTAPTQDVLITWAGNARARDNNPYNNITIPLAGNMRIDPIPQSYATMSLSPSQSPRSINWINQKIIPDEITISYNAEGQYANTEITTETVINGIGGSAFTFPVVGSITPPPSPPPHEDCSPGYHWDETLQTCVVDTVGVGDGNTVYVATATGVARTRNFLDASPIWADVWPTIVADTGGYTIIWFILDPYDPANTAHILTPVGIFSTDNLNSSPPTWTQTLATAGILGGLLAYNSMSATITVQGRYYISGWYDNGVNIFLYSIRLSRIGHGQFVADTPSLVVTGTVGDTYNPTTYVQASNWIEDNAFFVGLSNNRVPNVYKSTDKGATWTLLFTTGNFTRLGFGGEFAYAGGTALNGEKYMYVFQVNNTFGDLHRSDYFGSHWIPDPVHSFGGTFSNGSTGPTPFINVATSDENDVMLLLKCDDTITPGNQGAKIYRSSDAGVTWTLEYSSPATDYLSPDWSLAKALGRWPYDSNRIFILSGQSIRYSAIGGTDFSDSSTNKTGNWATIFGGAFANPISIIPLWIAG